MGRPKAPCHIGEILEGDRERMRGVYLDAARYRFLRDLPAVEAQAYFWHYKSRRERDKAIDAARATQGNSEVNGQ